MDRIVWIYESDLLTREAIGGPNGSGPDAPHSGGRITIYIDSKSALSALARADSRTVFIAFPARIFWEICARRGITSWFEWVPSDFNISDLPARYATLPFLTKSANDFEYHGEPLQMGTSGLAGNSSGFSEPAA